VPQMLLSYLTPSVGLGLRRKYGTTPGMAVGSIQHCHCSFAPSGPSLRRLIAEQCCRWPSGKRPSGSDIKANCIAQFRSRSTGPLELQLWPAAFAPDLLENVVFSALVMKCYVHTGWLLRAPCPENHNN
jgi:hypothetical protein